MTKAGERLIEAAKEAVAVAKGQQPAARVWIAGHAYVPEREAADTIDALVEALEANKRLYYKKCSRRSKRFIAVLWDGPDGLNNVATMTDAALALARKETT